MATKTRGPYDKEDTEKDFLDMMDASISEEEKQAMEQRAVDGAADDILKDSEEPESFFNVDGSPKEKSKSDADGAPGDPLDPTDEERKDLEDSGFYVTPASEETKQELRSGQGRMGRFAKRRGLIIASSIGLSVGGSILGFIFSVLPFELQHIKNVFETEIGGIKGAVVETRSGYLYSRAFFFHEDADGMRRFDGFKERGMVATLTGKNFRTQNVIADLRSKGFDFVPARDSTGRFTGRLDRIVTPDGDIEVNNGGGFIQAWRDQRTARKGLKAALKEVNGEPSGWYWRSRAARTVYSSWRYGALRGDWISDGVNRNLDSMRLIIRNGIITLRDKASARVSGIARDTTEAEGETTTTDRQSGGELQEEAADRKARLVDGEPGRRNYIRLLRQALTDPDTFTGQIGSAGLRAVNIFGTLDGGCELRRIANTVEVGARVLRAENLGAYATMFLSAADITLTGEVDAQDVGAFTALLRQKNPETGNDFFGSGSWQWASTGRGTVQSDMRNVYSVGGGFTGTLGGFTNQIDSVVGGNPNTVCGFATNIFVQIGGSIVGGLLSGISFGTFLAVSLGANLALGVLIGVAQAVFTPMIIDMVAGTIITGDEFGDEMAAGLLSGYNSLNGLQASNHGMRPLTSEQLAVLTKERDKNIAYEQSQMGIFERYFSPKNHRSITSVAAISMPTSLKAGLTTFGSFMRNPFSMVASPAGVILGNKSYTMALNSDQCTDSDVNSENFASDPFCNLLFGQEVGLLTVQPEDNLYRMLGGDPCAALARQNRFDECTTNFVDEEGFPADNARGELYQEYLDRCVNKFDIIHNNNEEFGSTPTSFCYEDNRRIDNQGTISYMSDQEVIAHHSKVHDFDDFDRIVAYQEGYELPGEAGRAYAQEPFETYNPTLIQRFRLHRMDQVIWDSMTEEWNGDFQIEGALATARDEAPSTGLIFPPNLDTQPVDDNGYFLMPESVDGSYEFNIGTPPQSRCGSETLIGAIYTVAQRWHEANPNSILRIGDLNEAEGHVSHRNGIDVDITVGAAPADPDTYDSRAQADPDAGNVAQDPTSEGSIQLARMFADTGVIDVIGYEDDRVINDYEEYARANDLPGRVASWSDHADHFHVRIQSQYRLPFSERCGE